MSVSKHKLDIYENVAFGAMRLRRALKIAKMHNCKILAAELSVLERSADEALCRLKREIDKACVKKASIEHLNEIH